MMLALRYRLEVACFAVMLWLARCNCWIEPEFPKRHSVSQGHLFQSL